MKRLLVQTVFVSCFVLTSHAGELPAWVRQSRPATAPALSVPAFERIIGTLREKGAVKLIVRLAPPSGLSAGFAIEGHLESPAAVSRQRSLIAEIQGRVAALLSRQHADKAKRFDFIPYMALDASRSEFEALVASADIEHIEEDIPFPPTLSQSVPLIGAVSGSFNGFSGSGQSVAILDTGIDSAHPFLNGKVVAEACYSTSDWTATAVCMTGSTAPGAGANCDVSTLGPGCTHGTHVAGIVAGKNSYFAGVAQDANLISVQVFSRFPQDSCGAGASGPCVMSYTSDQIKGLNFVYNLRGTYSIASVNMSLGGGSYPSYCDSDYTAEKAAIDALRSVGIATVIASGNDGFTSSISAPACISSAISVGATTKADAVASYSNSAPIVKLLAPGSLIFSSVPGGSYSTKSGTSMATPHVAGAWAVLKSARPSATVDEVLAALGSTGRMLTDTRPGATGAITKPRIRLDAAVYVLRPPGAPGVETKDADSISVSGARLRGEVNDNGALTTVSFDYGPSSSYGTNLAATSGGSIPARAGESDSAVILTALPCNTTYHYRVRAANVVGSVYGRDRSFTTEACVPGAPAIIVASAGNRRARITFAPPASDGGSAITGFTVKSNSGQEVSGTEIPITVPGLINGTVYSFTVTATNAAGTGPASAASSSVIPGIAVTEDDSATAYSLLENAYRADVSGKRIKLLAGASVGGLAVDQSNAKGDVLVEGGYDDDFAGNDGPPSIIGTVMLSAGTTRFRNVIVRPPP